MGKDIFISYRREDGYLFAKALESELTGRGFSVFFDREDLHTGDVFPEKLRSAVEECRDFIAVCSPAYLGVSRRGVRRITDPGDWVRQELSSALTLGCRVLPVLTDPSAFPGRDELPGNIAALADVNYIEYSQDVTIDEFVPKLIPRLSPETIENSRRNLLLERVRGVSDEDTPNYNILVQRTAMSCTEKEINEKILPILSSQEEARVRFTAYYTAYTFFRRFHYHERVKGLVEEHCREFEDFKFSNVIMSQYYRFRFEDTTGEREDLARAIEYARRGAELIPGNSGVLLTYAELVAIALESGFREYRRQLSPAVEAVRRAMEMNKGYAKQFCIYGRLLFHCGREREAILEIKRAIDLENSENRDSFIRITQYYDYINQIKISSAYSRAKRLGAMSLALGALALALSLLALMGVGL